MKLLIITQKVDKNDPGLGFFHRWLGELAKRYESLVVIALGVGEHDLPQNVRVISLGKELHPAGKLIYSWRFLRSVFKFKNGCDAVFVHMNQEYALLGGVFWRLWGKKIYLWRNHPDGSFLTRIAVALSHKVFCVSDFAFVGYSRKTVVMPAGIDLEMFKDAGAKREKAVLSLGRLSPIKKLEIIVAASALAHIPVRIYGSAPERDLDYAGSIRRSFNGAVQPGVPYGETVDLYNRFEAYVNATPTGSYDKAVLEAAACGCIPIVSNRSFIGKLPEPCLFKEGDSADLAAKIDALFALSDAERGSIRRECERFVADEQSLGILMQRLTHEIAD
ncbi:MAG: glycosyltransferase family 4 protein [Patescibacteria group bacterium]|nr:glycosyltransferase [Patescibacteria group bacterium]MDE1966809.1 glycosyltransferase family 4 protein [Patescibacteria group bacterium]